MGNLNSSRLHQLPHTTPWVLIRGLTRECRHWGGFDELLAEYLPGSRVHCVDLPGNGLHFRQVSPLTISQMMEQVRQELNVPVAVNILGLSMGGLVACDWASRYPHEVSGIVLINSSVASLSPAWQRLRWQVWWSVLRALLASVEQREAMIYRLTCNVRDDQKTKLGEWLRYQDSRPVSRLNFVRQLSAASRYQFSEGQLEHLKTPPLILAGRNDRLVNPECSRALASYLHCPWICHPSAGHDLTHDDPLWVIRQIEHWLQAAPVYSE